MCSYFIVCKVHPGTEGVFKRRFRLHYGLDSRWEGRGKKEPVVKKKTNGAVGVCPLLFPALCPFWKPLPVRCSVFLHLCGWRYWMSVSIPVLIAFHFFTQVAILTSVCILQEMPFGKYCHPPLVHFCFVAFWKGQLYSTGKHNGVWLSVFRACLHALPEGQTNPTGLLPTQTRSFRKEWMAQAPGKYSPPPQKSGGDFCWVRLHISWTLFSGWYNETWQVLTHKIHQRIWSALPFQVSFQLLIVTLNVPFLQTSRLQVTQSNPG